MKDCTSASTRVRKPAGGRPPPFPPADPLPLPARPGPDDRFPRPGVADMARPQHVGPLGAVMPAQTRRAAQIQTGFPGCPRRSATSERGPRSQVGTKRLNGLARAVGLDTDQHQVRPGKHPKPNGTPAPSPAAAVRFPPPQQPWKRALWPLGAVVHQQDLLPRFSQKGRQQRPERTRADDHDLHRHRRFPDTPVPPAHTASSVRRRPRRNSVPARGRSRLPFPDVNRPTPP